MNKDAELLLPGYADDYPEMNWAAQDGDGKWYFYKNKPHRIVFGNGFIMWQTLRTGFQFLFQGELPADSSKELYKIERKVTFLQLGENTDI